MTIARRRPDALAAIAHLPVPPAPTVPRPGAPSSLGDAPAQDAVTPVGRLRRCTFRRIDRVSPLPGRSVASSYEVMCLYVDREEPLALGDIDAAAPVCQRCTATGIFRPDED